MLACRTLSLYCPLFPNFWHKVVFSLYKFLFLTVGSCFLAKIFFFGQKFSFLGKIFLFWAKIFFFWQKILFSLPNNLQNGTASSRQLYVWKNNSTYIIPLELPTVKVFFKVFLGESEISKLWIFSRQNYALAQIIKLRIRERSFCEKKVRRNR